MSDWSDGDLDPAASFDLDEETAPPPAPIKEKLPHEEQMRRGLLIVFGVLFLVLTALQVTLGIRLEPDQYQAVSGPLGGVATVLAAAFGAAAIYYFTQKND